MQEYRVNCGEGMTEVVLTARNMGEDLLVTLAAGKVHVGAVALAVPVPRNAEGVTASVSVMTVPGHRDDIPAHAAALQICKAVARPVSLTAGLHIDNAAQEDINALLQNAQGAVDKFIKIYERSFNHGF